MLLSTPTAGEHVVISGVLVHHHPGLYREVVVRCDRAFENCQAR